MEGEQAGADTIRAVIAIDSLGGGGAEMALARMLPGLRDRGIEAMVVCLKERDVGVSASVAASGVPVLHLRSRRLVGRVRELRRLLRARRPDLLHTTLFDASLVGRLAARGLGVPVLTSLVNDAYGPARWADPAIRPWRLRLVQLVDGWTARTMTHHSHAITEAVADAATEQLGIDRSTITVIGRGHDPRRGTGGEQSRGVPIRDELGIGPDDPVVLAVGRHEYQKGHEHLLEATAVLRQRHPGLAVLIAGREGSRTAQLRAAVEQRDLADVVRLLGYRSDVGELLGTANVFAFPSLYEGLGNALIEAMAAGLPAVVSDLPALREVVGDHGGALFTSPGDADDLATAITTILADRNLANELGARNRTRFQERFTLDGVMDETAALYRRLASTPRSAALHQ